MLYQCQIFSLCECSCVPFHVLSDLDTEDLEALDLLHYSPVDVDGDVLVHPSPFHAVLGLTDVEREVVVLASHRKVTDLLPAEVM